ncbi:MAG: hypothetical protein ACRDL7_09130, partial [Gaiellaceae bacterium]
ALNRYKERAIVASDGNLNRGEFVEVSLQNEAAQYVALRHLAFGEGVERFAYRFFELAGDGMTVVGAPLVAKESKYILDHDMKNEDERRKFVRMFCSTQQFARRIADEFNEKLDLAPRVDRMTPRVSFLDCSVYNLDDDDLGQLTFLVEPRIDERKWMKWNTNNGVSRRLAADWHHLQFRCVRFSAFDEAFPYHVFLMHSSL